MKVSALTGTNNYFEDFKAGDVLKHARGKTVEPLEQVWITNVTMNTAEAHFNEHATKGTNYGQRLGFGGVTISMCIGLAAEDTAENALVELGMDKIRLKVPVLHGDTLYCYSEVLEKTDAEPSAIPLTHVVTGGEPGGGIPAIRDHIQRVLGVTVTEVMGIGDIAPSLFGECPHQQGMHFCGAGHVWVELIDPETQEPIEIETGAVGDILHHTAPVDQQPFFFEQC